MTEKYFVDSNILAYARDPRYPSRQLVARDWITKLWDQKNGVLSTQVIKEFYSVTTRKFQPAVPRHLAQAEIRELLTWRIIETDQNIFETAWTLEADSQCSWWDALIIAAAQHGGCQVLLSEDLAPHLMPAGLTLINPFNEVLHESPANYEIRQT